MTRYHGINHLALVTPDMDATVRFWRDLLGMRLVAGLGGPGYRQYFFQVSDHDLVAFFEWEGALPVPEKEHGRPVRGPVSFDHVSFGVASDDELWELKNRLEAAGIWVSEVIDHGFIHSIYAFDPHGIPLEFSWSVPSAEIRMHPRMADRLPVSAAIDGPDPVPGRWPSAATTTPPSQRTVHPGAGSELFHGKKA